MENYYIKSAETFVKEQLGEDKSGHDWHHIDRVRKLSLFIAGKEAKGNKTIIELGALLHDIPDGKLNDSEESGWKKLRSWFAEAQLDGETIRKVEEIISSISFSAKKERLPSIEAMIVQDGDRLDAIGAIGIARTFAYGGVKGQPIYDPSIAVREMWSKEEYRSGKSSSINHFHEKLLTLASKLNTETAKVIAKERHDYMEGFLKQFYKEWDVSL
ncbi:HD domain-containing protein [Actinomycetes bacterium NPDC127524]